MQGYPIYGLTDAAAQGMPGPTAQALLQELLDPMSVDMINNPWICMAGSMGLQWVYHGFTMVLPWVYPFRMRQNA